MANVLKKSADALRTAPFGFSLVGLAIASGPVVELMVDGAEVSDLYSFPIEGVSLAIGGIFVASQFGLRRRLENSIERDGYDERVMSKTTNEWCARQTARVVCRNSGDLAQYEELCERQSESAQLPRLPHI